MGNEKTEKRREEKKRYDRGRQRKRRGIEWKRGGEFEGMEKKCVRRRGGNRKGEEKGRSG